MTSDVVERVSERLRINDVKAAHDALADLREYMDAVEERDDKLAGEGVTLPALDWYAGTWEGREPRALLDRIERTLPEWEH